MRLTFLGTRGYIKERTEQHKMHTALGVQHQDGMVMIDCGEDWLGKLPEVDPAAVLLTHAHLDHAFGLAKGAPCPVYATAESWQVLERYPVDKRTVTTRQPFVLEGLRFEAFSVAHSLKAPAVAYRITLNSTTVFYAPDLVFVEERNDALTDVLLYIGDGATLSQSFVRRKGEALIGHTPVPTQLTWCQKHGIPGAIITHCGKEIVTGDRAVIDETLNKLAAKRGIHAALAYDGLELTLPLR